MSTNFQNFKYAQSKRNAAIAGGVIMVCITLLSCVSSFLIYREGFADMPPMFQNALGLFAVIVVEGSFVYLIYGLSRSFSSSLEKGFAVVGVASAGRRDFGKLAHLSRKKSSQS